MSFHRTILVAVATLCAIGITSSAFAGCGSCGWGGLVPFVPPAPVYGPAGCGGCGAGPAATYAPPVEPLPQVETEPAAPAPIAVDHWDTGGWGGGCGCGCGGCGCGGCRSSVAYAPPVAPSPLYVVNQGPEYSGPGFVIPYRTYSPYTGLAAPAAYPYIKPWHARYAQPYYGARYAYHPRYFGPAPYWHRHWYHRPLGVRG